MERLWYWYELLQLIVTPLRSLPETDKLQGRDGLYRVGADPEISFGGPRGAEVERRRREDRGAAGAEGVGCGEGMSPPHRGGAWRGGCAPSPENFSILHYKMACFGRF